MQALEKLLQTILELLSSPVSTSHTATGTNALVTIVLAADPGLNHRIASLSWSYSADPTGGAISIFDGGNLVYQLDVTTSGPGFVPVNLKFSAGAAVTVSLAAGGSAIVGKLNVQAVGE